MSVHQDEPGTDRSAEALRLALECACHDVLALSAEVGRRRELLKLVLCLLPRETPLPAELFPIAEILWRESVAKIETRLLRSENSETHETGV